MEIEDIVIGKKELKQVGILRLSQITLELEDIINKSIIDVENSIKEYKFNRLSSHIALIKENIREMNKAKCIRHRWNYWIDEILSYH